MTWISLASVIPMLYPSKTMSEPIPKRGNPAMRAGGPSLNPHGRPRVGASLADAYRSKWPPEKIVEHVGKLATGAASEQVRLAALQMIAERTAGKVPTVLDASITNGGNAPARDWSAMPVDDRRALLESIRRVPEVDQADEHRLPKPSLTDDDDHTANRAPTEDATEATPTPRNREAS